ncbi:MAG TPA: hypothetical protein VLH79_00370 [Chthonomonadales bacterium]|nr:hypothetical protein [Chthonomonadales bacterium]
MAVLIGVGLVAAAAWALWPKLRDVASAPPPAQPAMPAEVPAPASAPDAPRDARSPEDRARDELRASRIEFYQALRDAPAVVAGFGLGAQKDTLEVLLTRDDHATPTPPAAGIVAPRAADYGFRRIVVHAPGAPGEAGDRRTIAEMVLTDAGRWVTFRQ